MFVEVVLSSGQIKDVESCGHIWKLGPSEPSVGVEVSCVAWHGLSTETDIHKQGLKVTFKLKG